MEKWAVPDEQHTHHSRSLYSSLTFIFLFCFYRHLKNDGQRDKKRKKNILSFHLDFFSFSFRDSCVLCCCPCV